MQGKVGLRVCKRCGNVVIESECDRIDENGEKYYPYQCLNCDEDLFTIETILLDENEHLKTNF